MFISQQITEILNKNAPCSGAHSNQPLHW